MLRKFVLAASLAAALAVTGCSSAPKTFEPLSAEELQKLDKRNHRFEYRERFSYAKNLLRTMSRSVQIDDSRVPQEDLNAMSMAGTAYSVGSFASGLTSGFGLGLDLMMDLFTPSPAPSWKQSVAMIVMPKDKYPDSITALEHLSKQINDASVATTNEMGLETMRAELNVRSAYEDTTAKRMRIIHTVRMPAKEPGQYHWIDFGMLFEKKQFVRPSEKLPAWIDPKQPDAWVLTHIIKRRTFGDSDAAGQRITWNTTALPEVEREKLLAQYYEKLQKKLPDGVYIYVPPFKVDKEKMTPPYVMTKSKVWYFVVPEKK